MIRGIGFQVRDRDTGRFLQFSRERMIRWGWETDPEAAGVWTEGEVDRFIDQPWRGGLELETARLEKVPAPACGCCGETYRAVVDGRWQISMIKNRIRGETYWRCEKHVGRNPCCFTGCGKTFALKPDQDGRGGEDYTWRISCGKCWRIAPRRLRDRVTKIRRLARRRGWTDKISNLHSMAWEACRKSIEARLTAPAGEIVADDGPPPASLVAELARMGL